MQKRKKSGQKIKDCLVKGLCYTYHGEVCKHISDKVCEIYAYPRLWLAHGDCPQCTIIHTGVKSPEEFNAERREELNALIAKFED